MKAFDVALDDFVDALDTAHDDAGFRAVADRLARRLGFNWFAYLGFADPALKVLSSYPTAWARHYLDAGYERIDPVVAQARSAKRLFRWDRRTMHLRTASQQRFFWEASQFGIDHGVTIPIRGGFGRFAALTLAGAEEGRESRFPSNGGEDFLQLVGLYYHAHVYAKLQLDLSRVADAPLTQRERQCLSWAARGKKMPEIAVILGIKTRTIVFHLENARAKLRASTLTQAVAEALHRGLIAT